MKNHIITNTNRTIKKSFPRFLSLVVMSLLGVLVFVGLNATSPDMVYTLDKFFDDYNTYDIKIISNMGLTDNDIDTLKKLDKNIDVEGTYSKDLLIIKDDTEFVLNVSSLPVNINKLEVLEGHLPENDNEIVVEKNFLSKLGYKIDDIIYLDDDTFINKEVKIVGTIRSTLYYSNSAINQNRGTTTVGTGTINYYSYTKPSNFDIDYYTNIYLTVKSAKEKTTSTNTYNKLIEEAINDIEDIKSSQEKNRYDSIYNEANNEIISEEDKVNKELEESEEKLDSAKKDLDQAKKELDKTDKQLATFKQELTKAKKELDQGKEELQKVLNSQGISNISSTIDTISSKITELESTLSYLDPNGEEYKSLSATITELYNQKHLLQTLKTTEDKLISGTNEYNKNYSLYKTSYSKYSTGLKEYNNGLKKYNDALKEYNDNKEKALEELNNAKAKLDDIKHPTWYIYEREDDQTYSSYINQTKSMKSLSGLFPVVFYAVAILVSLISMNRMVEDDRSEIGTLKSLGFSNHQIKTKYILFSFSATILGALIGTILGLTIIPYIIFNIYTLLFDVPNFQFTLNLGSTLLGIIIAIVCICGSSIITANIILKDKPATLMRPKAPKSGKKILLENWHWLWHRLKFSNKITIRNILRYKKRVLVTIIGIAGCTALILCGFGLKDSIVDITNMQYVNTFKYDASIYTNDLDITKIDTILSNEKIKSYTLSETITGTYIDSNINIVVTEENAFFNIINLIDQEDNLITDLSDNKVIITDKLADVYNLKIGDKIEVLDSNKEKYNLEISNIAKNYLGHYIYMSKNTLENNNKEYEPNIIYINTESLSEEDEKILSNELLANDSIINVIYTRALVNSADNMLKSLDKVVVILVLLSAMLSFVVLYNLSNININERIREIATLKVLGFYDKEVDNYITKENILLTIFGIGIGLIIGYFLTNITISTVEMETARFIRHIKFNSYIYASLISCFFTIIVNFVTHFTLKKINMIESLKSVE